MLDCGAPLGYADLLPLLGPLSSRSPVLLLLLMLLLYVLPRSRGTGPLLLLLFLTFSVLVANPKKLLYTVANPARGLLNREKRTK